jgi:hypothetical protein
MIVAKIEITLDDSGQLNINGAIDNKMIAYGLLELGKEAVRDMHAEKARRIQAATPAERLAIIGGKV